MVLVVSIGSEFMMDCTTCMSDYIPHDWVSFSAALNQLFVPFHHICINSHKPCAPREEHAFMCIDYSRQINHKYDW